VEETEIDVVRCVGYVQGPACQIRAAIRISPFLLSTSMASIRALAALRARPTTLLRKPNLSYLVRRYASSEGVSSHSSILVLYIDSWQLKRTGLYDFHVKHGAKMVPFAGYSMPLSYGDVGQGVSYAVQDFSYR